MGEKSFVNVNKNLFSKNLIGIASKDESEVNLNSSEIKNNIIGIGLYNKKVFLRNQKLIFQIPLFQKII